MKHREQSSLSVTTDTIFNPDQVTWCFSDGAPVSQSHCESDLSGFQVIHADFPTTGSHEGKWVLSQATMCLSAKSGLPIATPGFLVATTV